MNLNRHCKAMAIITKGQQTSRFSLRLTETLLILTCCAALFTLEAKAAPSMSKTEVVQYLSQFGYMPPVDPRSAENMSHEKMSDAIAKFQDFAGMRVTGEMDDETTHMMTMSRCGMKDTVGARTSGRSRRWAPYGNTWPRKSVTYKISKYTRKLDPRAVDEETAKAFGLWSEHTDLTFSPNSGRADIDIKFDRGLHGPRDSFDGPGKVLAHALAPGKGTWIHFDDDESWSVKRNGGVNYLTVATHEIGHSLGLDHSRVKGSIMWPYISSEKDTKLHEDDIKGIQARYGPKTQVVSKDPPMEVVQLCEDPQIDTAFISLDGGIYFFKGERYWKLTTDGIAAGYPKLIAKTWKGLPSSIDYALTKESGQTYFFKGSKYWSYVGTRMQAGYPREVSDRSASTEAIEANKRTSSLAAMIYCIFGNKAA